MRHASSRWGGLFFLLQCVFATVPQAAESKHQRSSVVERIADVTVLAQDKARFALGVGIVGFELSGELARLVPDGGLGGSSASMEGDEERSLGGFYLTARGQMDNGLIFMASLSHTNSEIGEFGSELAFGPLPEKTKNKMLRIDFSVGYLFLRDASFRPFLHGGLSRVNIEVKSAGIKVVDDSSVVLTVGAGMEMGNSPHHVFYFDLNFDQEHEVDLQLDSGTAKFDMWGIQGGYLYYF